MASLGPPAGAGRASGRLARARPAAPARRRAGTIVPVLLALACVLITQYGYALHVPFINDDYIFLDKTRDASFLSNWALNRLQFHWYRPWSRELHYWTLQHLFGTREAPYHVVSFALWLGIGAAYAVLVCRLAGARVAAVATAGMAALAAWAVPLVWIAGVQELWMLLFGLLTLLAQRDDRPGLAAAAFVLALLSKETAAVLPAMALALEWGVRGDAPGRALRRTAGLWGILLAWAALHPVLGGRLLHPFHDPLGPGRHPAPLGTAARTLLMLVNLDMRPAPALGWARSLSRGLPAALALAALVVWAARASGAGTPGAPTPADPGGPTEPARVRRFALAWALLGWAPLAMSSLAMPSLGWHAYYALLGALGAWLALGTLLARRPALAAALVATLALLRSAQASTPSRDWGSEYYQARAGAFIGEMRDELRRLHPTLAPRSRLYFVMVPSNVGFLSGDAPALRVWYGDSTLSGGFFRDYTVRPAGRVGEDHFFRFDSLAGWVELVPGDSSGPAPADPRWALAVRELAATFARADDWPRAAAELERLARARPDDARHALEAGVARVVLQDTASALAWLRRAETLPGAPDSVRRAARELLTGLTPSSPVRRGAPGR